MTYQGALLYVEHFSEPLISMIQSSLIFS